MVQVIGGAVRPQGQARDPAPLMQLKLEAHMLTRSIIIPTMLMFAIGVPLMVVFLYAAVASTLLQ